MARVGGSHSAEACIAPFSAVFANSVLSVCSTSSNPAAAKASRYSSAVPSAQPSASLIAAAKGGYGQTNTTWYL